MTATERRVSLVAMIVGATAALASCVSLDNLADAQASKNGPTCGDTTTDSAHCGACNHDCLRGACVAGVCMPVVVARGQASPAAIVVDGTWITWANLGEGTIAHVPILGGTPELVASAQSSPRDLAIGNGVLAWTNETGGSVVIARAKDKPSVLAAAEDQPYGVALGNDFVAWTTLAGAVRRAPIAGGALTSIATSQAAPSAIAMIDGRLFWASAGTAPSYADGKIMREGAPPFVVSTAQRPRRLIARSGHLFWTTYGEGTVVTATPDGASVVRLADRQLQPLGVAADDARVYWVNEHPGGALMSVPIGGGAPIALVTGLATPHGIAVDDRAIYWTNYGDGTVMLLAK